MEKYNFDEIVKRSNSAKWIETINKFGTNDILSFCMADMDFQSAYPIKQAVIERAEEGIYGYAYRPKSYFESICSWFNKRHNWNLKEEWLIHTPLVMTSVTIYIKEFTKPGDKIIVQSPIYYPFFDIIKGNDREVVLNPLKEENGKYVMDYDDLEKKTSDSKVKLLILCSPHNPVGRVWTREELTKLGQICIKNNVKIISDEVHCDFVFNSNKHIPFASISQEFEQNSMTLISPSKTFNLAGLQQAIAILPNKEENKRFLNQTLLLDVDRNNCFGLVATEAAYRYGEEWFEQLLIYLQENIQYTIEYCSKNMPKVKPNNPEGTYLMWMDFRELGMDGKQLSDFLVEKAKVGLGSGYWFGDEGNGYARLNIACPRIILKRGLEGIKEAINNL